MGFLSSLIPFGNMNNLSKLVPVISFITLFIFVDIIVYFNMGWKKKAAEMMSEKSVLCLLHSLSTVLVSTNIKDLKPFTVTVCYLRDKPVDFLQNTSLWCIITPQFETEQPPTHWLQPLGPWGGTFLGGAGMFGVLHFLTGWRTFFSTAQSHTVVNFQLPLSSHFDCIVC